MKQYTAEELSKLNKEDVLASGDFRQNPSGENRQKSVG